MPRDRSGKGRKSSTVLSKTSGAEPPSSSATSKAAPADAAPAPARKGTRERVPKAPLSPMDNAKQAPKKQKPQPAAVPEPALELPLDEEEEQGGEKKDKPSRSKSDAAMRKLQSDPQLVSDVRAYMKANKLSQVTVGQEARISQAVISQWLSLKYMYHGHNDKVRSPP